MSEYRTIKEAAAVLGVSEKTIRRMIASGSLEASQGEEGKRNEWRIPQDALDQAARKPKEPRRAEPRSSITRENPAAATPATDAILAELQSLRAVIESQERTIEQLRAEQRDTRGQLGQLQDQVIRALPAPKKAGFLQSLLERFKKG